MLLHNNLDVFPDDKPQPTPSPLPTPVVYLKDEIQWEYKRIDHDLRQGSAPTADELNALGKDGWELVSTLTHGDHAYMYFKRQVDN